MWYSRTKQCHTSSRCPSRATCVLSPLAQERGVESQGAERCFRPPGRAPEAEKQGQKKVGGVENYVQKRTLSAELTRRKQIGNLLSKPGPKRLITLGSQPTSAQSRLLTAFGSEGGPPPHHRFGHICNALCEQTAVKRHYVFRSDVF